MKTESSSMELKAYRSTELAKAYGICDKTFKRWVEPFENQIGEKRGWYYNVAQVKVIFEKLGVPSLIAG